MKSFATLLCLSAALTGCETSHHIIVEQPKPLEINVNLQGRLELVITDARKDVEQITGQKPQRTVNPADVLPPDALQGSMLPINPSASGVHALACVPCPSILLLSDYRAPAPRPVAADDDLKAALAARYPQVAALLDAKVAGESHTGLLAPRGSLTPAQQALLTAENADRQNLYQLEAAKKNVSVEKIALGYFIARLGHINQGTWYEKYDKASKSWQWAQME